MAEVITVEKGVMVIMGREMGAAMLVVPGGGEGSLVKKLLRMSGVSAEGKMQLKDDEEQEETTEEIRGGKRGVKEGKGAEGGRQEKERL